MDLNLEIPDGPHQGASLTHLYQANHSQLRRKRCACSLACFNWQLWIPGAFNRWELIQAQELHSQLRLKQNVQQLNSDIGSIMAWLEKTQAELEALKLAEPPSNIQEMALRVKRLQVSGAVGGGER